MDEIEKEFVDQVGHTTTSFPILTSEDNLKKIPQNPVLDIGFGAGHTFALFSSDIIEREWWGVEISDYHHPEDVEEFERMKKLVKDVRGITSNCCYVKEGETSFSPEIFNQILEQLDGRKFGLIIISKVLQFMKWKDALELLEIAKSLLCEGGVFLFRNYHIPKGNDLSVAMPKTYKRAVDDSLPQLAERFPKPDMNEAHIYEKIGDGAFVWFYSKLDYQNLLSWLSGNTDSDFLENCIETISIPEAEQVMPFCVALWKSNNS